MLWPALLAVVATVYLIVRVVLTVRATDAPGAGPIAVQYTPPRELTPGTAVRLLRDANDHTGVTAEILDLAVRGFWQLGVREVDGTPTWFVRRQHPYEPILNDVSQAVYRSVFAPGDTALSRNFVADPSRSEAFREAVALSGKQVEHRGWVRRHKQRHLVLNLLGQALLAGALAVPVLTALATTGGLVHPDGPQGLPLIIYSGLVGFVAQFAGIRSWTLSREGRDLADQLEGLRRYMTLPDAERRAAAGQPSAVTVDRHERLLPYAVLFGIVPEWVQVLRADHERAGTAPTWVDGGGQLAAATASVFASLEGVGGLHRLGA